MSVAHLARGQVSGSGSVNERKRPTTEWCQDSSTMLKPGHVYIVISCLFW